MRIVHVINSLATGGAETLVVDLTSSMRDAGHQVTIVTIGGAAGVPLAAAERQGIRVVTAGRSPYDPLSLFRMRRWLRSADIVHVHLFPALYFAPLSAGRRPLVYTEHSTWNRRRESPVLRRTDRLFYRRYARLVAISAGVRDALLAHLESLGVRSEVDLIPNGISDAFFDRRRDRELTTPTKVIAVGNLDARKNFADAVRAIAALPEATLTIVGQGDQRDALAALIQELGVSDRVTLAGQSDDVGALMDEHHLLLSTSRFEGFSLVAAEAMAMGLPVVGPRVDGFRDSVADGTAGILFDQADGVEGIARAITTATRSAEAYHELAEGAANNAERFRVSDSARAYLELYERVRSTKPR
ncbi:glycosyltransferase [Leifsonia sp. fls2-241-R2A-40a]|uniref:glycosyltransferase n=1 Tax=Leifsonia sp. fls2-241-R2A-40a TaxID=3040290 RepID=UPI00254A8150|nr:glycosyltransferase [Leifsonia sp. fls2-241-R2A-40a]